MARKHFDAVQMTRALRDTLAKSVEGLDPDARMRFIREKAAASGLMEPVDRPDEASTGPDRGSRQK